MRIDGEQQQRAWVEAELEDEGESKMTLAKGQIEIAGHSLSPTP